MNGQPSTCWRRAAPAEYSVAIDLDMVVTFSRHSRRLLERWHPRRPAELTAEQAQRYEQGATEARSALGAWQHACNGLRPPRNKWLPWRASRAGG